ncbi:7-cyano-7-deazaguanine synthase [Aliarcobacter butzleri]|uniref:7-cyano-7-deazaguanine synthase n=1 Tax=Aliarcobacter butzleri TaxID=28197 RepID=UPI00344D1AD1
MKLAVISHSGGLDSTTLMGFMLEDGYTVLPINLNYGQENIVEMKAQSNVIEYFQKRYGKDKVFDTLELDLTPIVNPVQNIIKNFRKNGFKNKELDEANLKHYFPNRNMLFVSIAAVFAETFAYFEGLEEATVCIGIHKHTTYKPYWDITVDFANAVQNVVSLNNAIKVTVATPFVEWTKSDIVKYMLEKGIPYELTWTCYEPQIESKYYIPCKKCQACIERENAGIENKISNINEYMVKKDK